MEILRRSLLVFLPRLPSYIRRIYTEGPGPSIETQRCQCHHRSIAPCTVLLFPELVHLGYALLEFDVLALLVAMPLVLDQDVVSAVAPRTALEGILVGLGGARTSHFHGM